MTKLRELYDFCFFWSIFWLTFKMHNFWFSHSNTGRARLKYRSTISAARTTPLPGINWRKCPRSTALNFHRCVRCGITASGIPRADYSTYFWSTFFIFYQLLLLIVRRFASGRNHGEQRGDILEGNNFKWPEREYKTSLVIKQPFKNIRGRVNPNLQLCAHSFLLR